MPCTNDESIYSTTYYVKWPDILRTELKSWLYRTFFNREPKLLSEGDNFLNLGCGANLRENFVNADFFVLRRWRTKLDWMLDARYPLNCRSDSFSGVFSEHMMEHLYPVEMLNLLKEIRRILKPGSWLRVAVPDLRKYVDYYNGVNVDERFHIWPTGCEAIRSLTQNYGHRSTWDADLLRRFMAEAGFANIKEVHYREGTDDCLCIESEARRWETLYMEAQKPHL